MSAVLIAFVTLALIMNVTVIMLAEGAYRLLRPLPTSTTAPSLTASVAIIVPARNESAVIERVVGSLVALHYPNFQVTVVDDDSIDDTARKAGDAGASVMRVSGTLPPGWTGKCNACDYAARHVSADWLLFTDADTYHQPDSLRDAVQYAEAHHLDALSLLLRQECGTFWECLTLPIAYQNFFAILFSTLRAQRTVFNGQYILIRRGVYQASGGFGAVRGRVMEDVALAEMLTQQGYRIQLLNGHEAASVRMYQDLPALLGGMTKTAYTAARDRGWRGVLLALPFFLGTLILPALLIGLYTSTPALTVAAFAVIVLTGVGLLPWLRRFDVQSSGLYAAVSHLGVLLFFWIGVISTLRALTGHGVRWKGRTIIERRSYQRINDPQCTARPEVTVK